MLRGTILLVLLALAVSGCKHNDGTLDALPVTRGPAAQVLDRSAEAPLACLGTQIAQHREAEMAKLPKERRRPLSFGILDVLDKTGAENRVGNDSFGTFMSQGTSDMLSSTLSTVGVPTIELSVSYRVVVDWLSTKGASPKMATIQSVMTRPTPADEKLKLASQTLQAVANVSTPDIGLIGAITSFDGTPGGGVAAGFGGVGGNYSKNAVLAVIDLRAVEMPKAGRPGGRQIAHATISKQIVQDGFNLTLDRYLSFGPNSPRLVNLEAGYMRREPTKFSNREMVELAAAEVLSQIYKYHRCTEEQNIVTALN